MQTFHHFTLALLWMFFSVQGTDGGGSGRTLKLEVVNEDGEERGILKLTEGSTLNLTCRVSSPIPGEEDVKLNWYVPNNMVQPGTDRYKQEGRNQTSTLVINPVIETDTGNYECWAKQHWGEGTVKTTLKVLIEPNRGTCQHGYYQCKGRKEFCIPTRYRCDLVDDCPGGDDESDLFCGHKPCQGKLICADLDFRCIDPREYCCDPETDLDCKFVYECCKTVIDFSLGNKLTSQYTSKQSHDNNDISSRESDLAYLHSTVYTIIGCASAFILIVSVLGVAICRLHMQRKASRNTRIVRGAGRSHPPITLHDLDIYFSERGEEERGDYQHIGITYNINHGVQIMGGGRGPGVHPPPYSTEPRSARPSASMREESRDGTRRGPPPPYRSNENLAEADRLLGDDDGNNNGDINGNSEMTDNNVIPAEVIGEVERDENIEEDDVRRRIRERRLDGGSPPPRYPGIDNRDRRGYSNSSTDTE